jgi:hypothetical protein
VAIGPDVLRAGGPAGPARPLDVSPARTARRIVADRWASRLVVVGGIVIIASILAILFVIAAEVYPLSGPDRRVGRVPVGAARWRRPLGVDDTEVTPGDLGRRVS